MPHATLTTATGTIVNHFLKYSDPEYTDAKKQQLQQDCLSAYPGILPTYYTKLDLTQVELLPTKEYNCWGFTFDPRRCVIASGTDVENILNDNADSVPDGAVEVGDVICYRNGGTIQHTGRVCEIDDQGHATMIRSKWGALGEYLHPPSTAPAPYGTDKTYWRMHAHLGGRAVLFAKDNDLDTSFQYSPDPLGESPDIWVDNNLDGNPNLNPIANQVNHIYSRVRNNGTVPIDNVEVRFYWADPSVALMPSDWNLIAAVAIPTIAANSETVSGPVLWTPQSLPEDQCLLVIANGGDSIIADSEPDPIVYPFDVRWENCITMKNLVVQFIRDPVDLEMIMDVSDSMNSPSPSDPGGDSKLTLMKQAATMITDFLNDHAHVDDRMGLVWFADDASEYQNPNGEKLLPIVTNWVELRAQIKAHGTGFCTAMGSGLQAAFETLSPSARKRLSILCTDGMQNIEPKVTKVGDHYEIVDSDGWLCGGHSSVLPHPGVNITGYDTCIQTIGVGIIASYATLLEEIAGETNGFYRGTDDPENDLDLAYFLALCNCLTSGSPAVIHHNAGSFCSEECEAEEIFYLNRSVRKITVMLSWKESEGSNLTFWLHSPDGTLLILHNEMKHFETHCMATIGLPRQQDGEVLAHVGQWRMTIRGETPGACADYHAFVIGEDYEVKYKVGFPRRLYEVGDELPIRISLTELEKPILRPGEILVERAQLREPLPELLAQYRASSYELLQKASMRICEDKKDPIVSKIEAMASDPCFRERLTPSRDLLSLQKGDLECQIGEKEVVVPIALEQPGLHSFKVVIQFETPGSGPICRTDMVSVNVGPGKADSKLTGVTVMEFSKDKLKGALIHITPRNEKGQLLGPGLGHELKVIVEKKELEIEVEDQLDGTYRIELSQPKKARRKTKEESLPVIITFHGRPIWKGRV